MIAVASIFHTMCPMATKNLPRGSQFGQPDQPYFNLQKVGQKSSILCICFRFFPSFQSQEILLKSLLFFYTFNCFFVQSAKQIAYKLFPQIRSHIFQYFVCTSSQHSNVSSSETRFLFAGSDRKSSQKLSKNPGSFPKQATNRAHV